MQKRHLQKLLTVLLSSLSLWSTIADAATFNLRNQATPRISIWVGSHNNISEVTFNVLADQLGNGTPIAGSRKIRIELRIQSTAANPLTGSLTVDSVSNPLTNTASTTTIPFSEISWTARDGDIPSGVYQEIVDQDIVSFQSSQRYRDFHTFSYANTMLIEAGTYRGSVIYTWSIP